MPPSNPVTPARLLFCALTLFAGCAKSVASDLPALQNITDPDSDAGATNELGGAPAGGSSGSNASSGSVGSLGGASAAGSAGAGAMGGVTTGSGGSANGGSANGGSANGGSANGGSAGAGNSAGKGGSGGTGNSAGSGNAGSTGSAGSTSTSHVCKTTIDLNTYTVSKDGCGGYAVCKGQIHFMNDEDQALNMVSIAFSVTNGVTCTGDHSGSKWTITDNGASSKHCVFTASGAAWSVDSGATFGFGYDTTQGNSTAPKDVTISDPSCGG